MIHFLLSDFGLFWGRLHPLIVHFPVVLVMLALVLNVLIRYPRFEAAKVVMPIVLWATVAFAGLAVWMGISLENHGRHAGEVMDEHKLLGILLTVSVAIATILYQWFQEKSKNVVTSALGIAALLTAIAGHHGGELTHGSSYLSSVAPGWLGGKELGKSSPVDTSVDSVLVYEDLLQPVLIEKCARCHGTENTFEGLDVTSWEAIAAEAGEDALWKAGDPAGSLIIKRTSLPQEDRFFMPPSGEPMTYNEIRLFSWWIDRGAERGQKLEGVPEELHAWMMKRFGLDITPRPYLERTMIPVPEPDVLHDLTEAGWNWELLATGNGLLEVSANKASSADMNLLQSVSQSIAVLDLSRLSSLKTTALEDLEFPHLTRLDLSGLSISASSLQSFQSSPHLESVTLVGASLESGVLASLGKMNSLQRLFLWKAELPEEELSVLSSQRPDLDINQGFQFAPVE